MPHASSGRWPRDPKEKSTNSENSSHSHIRVVPRANEADRGIHSDSDAPTPTFCSLSLLRSVPCQDKMRSTPDRGNKSGVQSKTFADMAREFCVKDSEADKERLSHPPASVAGIIKLQSNHQKTHERWLPDKPDDGARFQDSSYHDHEHDYIAPQADHQAKSSPPTLESIGAFLEQASHRGSQVKGENSAGKLESEALRNFPYASGVVTTTRSPRNLTANQPFARTPNTTDMNDQTTEAFGKLPDPIRLHEQLGEFDGQVIFIGHPNRDVSAHQWSSAAFQWENIGHYAHCRSRIEGLLAFDVRDRYGTSCEPLLLFKSLAQNREKAIVERGRSGFDTHTQGEPLYRKIAPDASSRNISQRPSEEITVDTLYGERFQEIGDKAIDTTAAKIKVGQIDDPFLTPIESREVRSDLCSQATKGVVEFTGSLDFGYEFPVKSDVSKLERPIDKNLQGGLDAGYMLCRPSSLSERHFQRGRRDIVPDEDTSIGSAFSDASGTSARQPPNSIHPTVFERDLRNAAQPLSPALKRPTGPQAQVVQPTARSLFPSMGLTVANPHRNMQQVQKGTSNGVGPNYTSDTNRSERLAVKYDTLASLQSSDPDGVLQSPCPDIANGLSHQLPTVQNFKGPFFTASKPTSHDPTVSLAVEIDEEEKLHHWFCDGHRPARQREYAKSLASAAATAGRFQGLAATDDGVAVNRYSNADITTPFVRLYETLSEYVDELHKGGGSYFSGSWKPAAAHLRDLGPGGNNSYFSDCFAGPSKVSQQRKFPVDYHRAYGSSMGGVIARSSAMQYYRSRDQVRGHSGIYTRNFSKAVGKFHAT